MNVIQSILLELIRMTVDDKYVVDRRLVTYVNWREVMALCSLQGVMGICFDALERMEEASRPPKMLLIEWLGQVVSQENLYKQHKEALGHLAHFYEQEGIRMLLLKGYGLSLCWPKPEHRPVGDIDCYTFGQEEEADKRVTEKYGIEIDNSHHKHSVFQFENVTVENHYSFLNVHGHRSTAEIERILEEEVENNLNLDLNLDFNLNNDRKIKELGMARFEKAMKWVIGYVFEGKDVEDGRKYGKMLLAHIMDGDNFGQHKATTVASRHTHIGRFANQFAHDLQLVRYYPSEAVWAPLSMIREFIRIRI